MKVIIKFYTFVKTFNVEKHKGYFDFSFIKYLK